MSPIDPEVFMRRQAELKNKKAWGPGPWQDEPDRLEFRYLGFPCLMVRNMDVTGGWCGYVGVPPGHKFHKKKYDDVDVDVHGGLTYSDKCQGHVCHVPRPGESEDAWWLGFDCAHFDDVSPKMNATMDFMFKVAGAPPRSRWGTYKDVAYVKREVRRLARQVAKVK